MPEGTNAAETTPLPEETKETVAQNPFDLIPEEIRSDPNIAKYKSIDELAKGHLEVVKLVGKKGVIVPGPNASEEEKAKFYEAVGRPKTADDYKLEYPKEMHPKITVSPESEAAFKQVGHKLGLTNEQINGLNGWYMSTVSQGLTKQDEATKASFEAAQTQLRTEWGPEFNANVTLAKRVIEKYGGKEAAQSFGDLGNNVAVLRFLANVGKKMSEASFKTGEFNELIGTAQEAKQKLDDLNARILKMDSNDPAYPKLIAERTKLYELAYPGEAA
jgi:hypothetical protein